jgi:hypothetical protein
LKEQIKTYDMATIAIGISKGGGYTCKVPTSSISESGVAPEQGDQVEYSVSGTVQSVSGNQATVKIDAINGEPVAEEGAESPEEEAAEPETGTEGGGAASPAESAASMGARLKKGTRGMPLP